MSRRSEEDFFKVHVDNSKDIFVLSDILADLDKKDSRFTIWTIEFRNRSGRTEMFAISEREVSYLVWMKDTGTKTVDSIYRDTNRNALFSFFHKWMSVHRNVKAH